MIKRRHWIGALVLLTACGGRAKQSKAPPSQGVAPPQPAAGVQDGTMPWAYPQPPAYQPKRPTDVAPTPEPAVPALPQLNLEREFRSAGEAETAVDADERELLAVLETEDFSAAGVSQCGRACRALASMRRSVQGLCRLTGDTNERCTKARRRLAEAGTRVREAGCSCSAT